MNVQFFPCDIFALKKFKNRHRKIGDDLNDNQQWEFPL